MVSAFQAKAMGMAAKGLARSKKYINEEWEKLTPEQRDEAKKYDFYLKPIRDDFIELANKFSEWAPKSKGFAIK